MKNFHIRRNFLKLAKRVGLFGFSALGVGTVVGLGTAQSAKSQQSSKSTVVVGGDGTDGTVSVRGSDGQPLVELLGRSNEAVIGLGQKSRPARLTMYNGNAQPTVNLSTADATLALGGSGINGTVSVRGADGQPLVELLGRDNECVIGLGQKKRPGRISVYGSNQEETILLSGGDGDIILRNADCAEEFDIVEGAVEVEPGMVMVIEHDGALRPSDITYDKRVAGVISGAGDYKPGIVLDRKQSAEYRLPIALVGKVYCKVDAEYGSIQVGDLLTTSPTPGHAMKVDDPLKGFGAVLGKALGPLEGGRGLIPVLVALQ